MNNNVKRYTNLFLGNIINAYAVTCILRPNGLMSGGLTGFARVLEGITFQLLEPNIFIEKYYFNIIYYFLTIVVLILTYIFLGKSDALRIVFLSIFYPTLLFVFTFLDLPTIYVFTQTISGDFLNDLLVLSIIYGFLIGLGTGLVLKSGFTSGGTDTIAKIAYRTIYPFFRYSQILLLVDAIIILTGFFLFGIQITVYAIIIKYIATKTVDMVLLGISNKLIKIEIISTRNPEIVNYIQTVIHRGVTCIEVEGQFKKEKVNQINTICSPKEGYKIKNYIATVDEKAFIHLIYVPSVWGNGFKNIYNDELS
jgi:uncharacterized membrane-anchored protein YitT (DUF2179 family)